MAKIAVMQICLGVLPVFLLVLLSCTEIERHKTLTFFFDGVPPLENPSMTVLLDPNAVPDPNAIPEVIWYQHEPELGCEACHGDRQKHGFSRQVNLVAPVPDLCYQCHEQLQNLTGHVHGPVAVGVCTFCHEPHRTRNQYLLKKPVPDLCHQCHEPDLLAFFDSKHADKSYSNCIRCHEGHSTETHGLLKKDWQETVSSSF